MADGAAYLDVRGVFKRFRDTRVIENLDLEQAGTLTRVPTAS